jgi:hypothetical protein
MENHDHARKTRGFFSSLLTVRRPAVEEAELGK